MNVVFHMSRISVFITAVTLLFSGFATSQLALANPALGHLEALRSKDGVPSSKVPKALQGVGIEEHLGNRISADSLHFRDETGRTVYLKDYLKASKPVLLTLVYYDCPNLCSYVLSGLVQGLKKINWVPGKQFEVVAVSINPNEGPGIAARKKAAYLESYGVPATADGWHFLTGDESQIQKLASEVGFHYKKDGNQFAHNAAIYALTPDGKISRYLYGIDFKPTDLKLALLEASNGKIGSVIDRFLLFCYRYDPVTKKYSFYLYRVMRAGGVGTVLVFGTYLAVFWTRELRSENDEDSDRIH